VKIADEVINDFRDWEQEFPDFLHPLRTRGGQRRYDENDLRTIYRLKELIHKQRYSLAGARRALSEAKAKTEAERNPKSAAKTEEKLHEVLEEIREILQGKLLGGQDGEALASRDNVGANS